MSFLKHVLLFSKNNLIQLRRKWLPLPLLFLFPIILIGLITTIILAFFSPSDQLEPIRVGVVDLDQSKETQLIIDLIDETSQLGAYIQLESMSETEAIKGIETNKLSTYIELPEHFTADLYHGTPVTLPISGNPYQVTESHLIKTLIDSVTRHIRTSQANILTINHYANALAIDDTTRNDLLFEHFKHFLFYTIGKDKVLNEEEITNLTTASPVQYYGIAGWFITVTIWLFIIYTFLHKEETNRLKKRMKLYGVTELQQVLAKIVVTLVITAVFAIIAFVFFTKLFDFELWKEDYIRIAIIMLLYSILILFSLAIIETITLARKFCLLGQSVWIGILLLFSGAFIPTLYFPLKLQAYLPYVFSSEAFYWLQEVILNERFYTDYIPLLLMNATSLFMLIGFSLGKERVQQ